eukprot:scaffold32777_cov112-Isochrysis_galbana.AAC.1
MPSPNGTHTHTPSAACPRVPITSPQGYGVMDKEREMLLACAKGLSSCVGACERIVQTPIPLHYSRHTSRFLTLYCNSLPLVITPSL